MALTTAFQNEEDVFNFHDEWAIRFATQLANDELFESETTRMLVEELVRWI